MAVIAVPGPLREKLGDEAVDSLVDLLNKSEDKAKGEVIVLAEEKYERRLSEETGKLGKRITDEVAKLDKRITEECSAIRVEMKGIYANIIKWMFIFWIGQMGAILGILFAFFKP